MKLLAWPKGTNVGWWGFWACIPDCNINQTPKKSAESQLLSCWYNHTNSTSLAEKESDYSRSQWTLHFHSGLADFVPRLRFWSSTFFIDFMVISKPWRSCVSLPKSASVLMKLCAFLPEKYSARFWLLDWRRSSPGCDLAVRNQKFVPSQNLSSPLMGYRISRVFNFFFRWGFNMISIKSVAELCKLLNFGYWFAGRSQNVCVCN